MPARPPFLLAGGPAFGSEELLAYELGYRIQPSERLSLSLATFYNNYNDLRSLEQVNPPAQFLNAPGGVSPIRDIAWDGSALTINGKRKVFALTAPAHVGAFAFDSGMLHLPLSTTSTKDKHLALVVIAFLAGFSERWAQDTLAAVLPATAPAKSTPSDSTPSK